MFRANNLLNLCCLLLPKKAQNCGFAQKILYQSFLNNIIQLWYHFTKRKKHHAKKAKNIYIDFPFSDLIGYIKYTKITILMSFHT